MKKVKQVTYGYEYNAWDGLKLSELQQLVDEIDDDFNPSSGVSLKISTTWPGPQSDSDIVTLKIVAEEK